jgi:hypothetical protein
MPAAFCCYPYLRALLGAAVRTGPRLVGLTCPRDVWWMRAFMQLFNVAHALRRSPAHYFIHRHPQVERLMVEAGYVNAHEGGTRGWRVVLYRRG